MDLLEHRSFLKDSLRKQVDFSGTDQHKGLPAPPLQVGAEPDCKRIVLSQPGEWPEGFAGLDLTKAVSERQSRRHFLDTAMSQDELSYLLWASQGIRRHLREGVAMRNVPSAGSRHAFETHLVVRNIEGLEQGHYRYLPLEHELAYIGPVPAVEKRMTEATLGQEFCGKMAVTFVWSCVPYRMEWRYGLTAHRVILMDAGHVCQNLYLACEAIECGTCAVAAYDQDSLDDLLGLDGEEEFAIYLAPVGKR